MTTPRDFAVERRTEEDGDTMVTVLAVAGDLDYASYTRLEAALEDAIAAAPRALVVDLGEVTYCDSCGLRVLLGAAQGQRRGGGEFTLRGVAGQPRRALRLTGLDMVLGGEDATTGSASSPADGPTVQA